MVQYISSVVSIVLFLIGIFLFRSIFPALGIALMFLLLTTLSEIIWQYRETPLVLSSIYLIIAAVLALVFYTLIYLPVEFLITEILLITPKISPFVGLTFLFVLVVAFSFIDWSKIMKEKSSRFVFVTMIAVSCLVYGVYRHNKLAREYLPKIYRINPNSGIQAEKIEIKGVNFHPVWKKGKVFLDSEEMVIRDWSERLIVIELPVPAKFGNVNLYVVRDDGVEGNKIPFKIEDPKDLVN